MFDIFDILKDRCLVCDKKEIYKYNLCRDCVGELKRVKENNYRLEHVDEVYIMCYYNSFVKKLMWQYKFHDKTYILNIFGEILTDFVMENELYKKYDVLTYIPMDERSYKVRGYNQSKFMADFVSDNTLMDSVELLKKVKHVNKQECFGRLERVLNVKDVFSLAGDFEPSYDGVLIVDDVITTGATLNEAGRILKTGGIKKVAALVVATRF